MRLPPCLSSDAALEAHRITQHSAQRLPQEPRCADGSGHSMPQYALMTAVVTPLNRRHTFCLLPT